MLGGGKLQWGKGAQSCCCRCVQALDKDKERIQEEVGAAKRMLQARIAHAGQGAEAAAEAAAGAGG